MKVFSMLSAATLVVSGWVTSFAQDLDAEVPGDHFSLEGALELFKKSESPEHFEKLLNSPDSKVNNLDLNGDGFIDYIRVFDRQDGNVHVFILQAVVSNAESQDVAVIELEKKGNGEAVLQIVGDADIYGIETIIEPTSEVRTYAGTRTTRNVVNVWSWPVVHYVYGPHYSVWYSPWGWHSRPIWWSPWRPVVYVSYYDYWSPYRYYYAPCNSRRIVYAYNVYHPYRTTSVIVRERHHTHITRYRTAYNGHSGRERYEARGKRNTRGSDNQRTSDMGRGGRTDRFTDDSTNGRMQSANQSIAQNSVERKETNSRWRNDRQPVTRATGNEKTGRMQSIEDDSDSKMIQRQRATENRNVVGRNKTQERMEYNREDRKRFERTQDNNVRRESVQINRQPTRDNNTTMRKSDRSSNRTGTSMRSSSSERRSSAGNSSVQRNSSNRSSVKRGRD